MGRTRTKVPAGGAARALIDELIGERKVLARAQARNAELMVEFADTRTGLDRQRIKGIRASGFDARYKAGEFAASEVSMACSTSKYVAQRVIAMTRRVQAEAPDAWDAWRAGDIDQDKVERINRALRRLQLDSSKVFLNALVVDVAVCKTPEILGRWLNQFILSTEGELQDERLERSAEDRYVSVRPDLDGMSFLTAELSAVDAYAIDQVLNALAGIAEPGDTRTLQQRRADALVDVLLGRVTNGCHVVWDTNTDVDDHLDDPDVDDPDVDAPDPDDQDPGDHDLGGPEPDDVGTVSNDNDAEVGFSAPDSDSDSDSDSDGDGRAGDAEEAGVVSSVCGLVGQTAEQADDRPADHKNPRTTECRAVNQAWDASDWEQPASTFRPDHRIDPDNLDGGTDDLDTTDIDEDTEPEPDTPGETTGIAPPQLLSGYKSRTSTYPAGTTRILPCPSGGQPRPLPVTIGIVVTAQSLFGFSNTPGQLMDRSASVPANRVRELAHHKGTLFYRLLTDEKGNLLDVTELGRFPSRKLAIAVKLRDGTCTGPTCTTPATRCDIDHLVPVPDGQTTAENLNDKCRNDHRAKTHAGHQTTRTGPHTTEWTTPTGHKYAATDMPFPTEQWPTNDHILSVSPPRR